MTNGFSFRRPDFFTPIVDDPWLYGTIAAANSMSDVYAMGGEVRVCLNIAGFPEDLPTEVIAEILAGGAAKVQEGRCCDRRRTHGDQSRAILWLERHRRCRARLAVSERKRSGQVII